MNFSYARTALKYGLSKLKLRPDSEIIFPDFICDVILQPLHELNINYNFYSLNDDLTPDWESVKGCINSSS